MNRQLNAQDLLDFLLYVKANVESYNKKLSDVKINYRKTFDHDINIVDYVAEDLFDEQTNKIIETIILTTNKNEISKQ